MKGWGVCLRDRALLLIQGDPHIDEGACLAFCYTREESGSGDVHRLLLLALATWPLRLVLTLWF